MEIIILFLEGLQIDLAVCEYCFKFLYFHLDEVQIDLSGNEYIAYITSSHFCIKKLLKLL